MFRILGFIIGSIVSIAALVMLVGMPNFHLSGELSDEARYGTAIRQLKEKQQTFTETVESASAAKTTDESLPATSTVDETVDHAAGKTTAETTAESSRAPDQVAAAPMPLPEITAEDAATGDVHDDNPPLQNPGDNDPEWYAFWNPFRSEIAARGFVGRLENITGLDYRVVKVKNGVYQVAFSYSSDTERSSKLSQISAATGLDLSDTVP